MTTRSVKNQHTLDALRRAVTEALDRKRRLGEYAVIWRDGQVVRLEADELPVHVEPGRHANGD